ncbi:DUF445 domain-containing protein [Selenomonas sp. AE3005]|uniref:DUF445 domain-containing protein n=1 Tax=Selenomonas sp. AE3005 TaxID=1485543 RepID=UPI0004898EF4|nr:DUF445 family protein [Selenomonas sp. AE3005]
MSNGFNKADKTLLIVFILFLGTMFLHLCYPHSLAVDGLLFASEAALVGGIADWFAVTALFRKPLGFPYHTAILPRRRDAFIKASTFLVQQEFFSRRKIFNHLERLHIMPMVMNWLKKPATSAQLTSKLVDYVRDFLLHQNTEQQARVLAEKVRESLARVEPEDFFAMWGGWLRKTGKDKDFVMRVAGYWQQQAQGDEARKQIQQMLEAYEEEKIGENPLARLMAGFAQAIDLINYEEAAALIQQQLLVMLQELGTRDSQLQQDILHLFYEKAEVLNQDAQFHQLTHELKDSLLRDLPVESAIRQMLAHLQQHFLEDQAREVDPLAEHMPALRSRLEELIGEEYERTLRLLERDENLRAILGSFLYDVIARTALHAQALIGVIVRDVLLRLTDEQLNHLVYDKVEPDLLWIRMNGSIVGAGIGLIMFVLLHIAGV